MSYQVNIFVTKNSVASSENLYSHYTHVPNKIRRSPNKLLLTGREYNTVGYYAFLDMSFNSSCSVSAKDPLSAPCP